jgi:hypothetical protein
MQMQELQLKMQELELKKQELQIKAKKIEVDGAAKMDELAMKKQDLEAKAQLEMVKITQDMTKNRENLQIKQQLNILLDQPLDIFLV